MMEAGKVGAGRNAPRVSSPVLANSIVLSYLRPTILLVLPLSYPLLILSCLAYLTCPTLLGLSYLSYLIGLSYLLQRALYTLPHLPHLQYASL